MKKIEKEFSKLEGRLLSIERDTIYGRYHLKIGFPKNWVYDSIDEITVKEIGKTKNAVLLEIFSEEETVVIDDLFKFVNIIIETNENIEKKEKEFEEKLQRVKDELKKEAEMFSSELETMKAKSLSFLKNKSKQIEEKEEEAEHDDKNSFKEEEIEEKLKEKLS